MLAKVTLFTSTFFATLLLLVTFGPQKPNGVPIAPPTIVVPQQPLPIQPEIQLPPTANITNPIPGHLSYSGIVEQLRQWNREAPAMTEIGVYGKTSKGKDLYFIRINGKNDSAKPKVLITACIHGNEPHSTSIVMGYAGSLLDRYGKSLEITKLLDTRDIYIIPVVSPDSYPSSRHVDGVDPNRDFINKTSAPVRALQNFFLQHKFSAVISGHTFGRMLLIPYGDKMSFCSNHQDYMRIVGQMGRLTNYRILRACELYSQPIYGGELDWFYRNGAFSLVMEFGTHQHEPTMEETKYEFERTWKAILIFLEEAPKVEISKSYYFKRAA